jgi:hypothetical protein
MYQPELKTNIAIPKGLISLPSLMSNRYSVFIYLVQILLKTKCNKICNWLKKQKEQRPQHLE